DQGDPHAGAEYTLGGAEPLAEAVVERLGLLAGRHLDVARPVAPVCVAVEGELADAEHLALAERLAHPSLLVLASAHRPPRVGPPSGLLRGVAAPHPEQEGQARPDLGDALSLDIDRGLAHSLDERSHSNSLCMPPKLQPCAHA